MTVDEKLAVIADALLMQVHSTYTSGGTALTRLNQVSDDLRRVRDDATRPAEDHPTDL